MSTLPSLLKVRSANAFRAAFVHLLLSATIASIVAVLVFGRWFPSPLRELVGGTELFWLIVAVDVVCGPLLTFVVFNPSKPQPELRRDIALVALIQLLALGYGLHTLSQARPLVLAYEVDRFRLITYADLDMNDLAKLPDWAKPWGLARTRTIGLRAARTSAEKLSSIDASLQGVEPSQRPSWWQDYSLNTAQVLDRSRPLLELRQKHTGQDGIIDLAVAQALADHKSGETNDGATLRWLPLVSHRTSDWIALLDPFTARVRGYANLDGF